MSGRIKLTVAYDGEAYVGWQVQPNGPSVQAVLEAALARLVGVPTPVWCAGRTDAGVHALGQVVAFDAPRALPLKAYVQGLNALLPKDIAVRSAALAAPTFDPRRAARGKHYRYLISNLPHRLPQRRRSHWEVFPPLSLDALKAGAALLVGEHDFSSFRAADCQAKNARRVLHAVEVDGRARDELALSFKGTAFLKHMVRNLVGSLVEVGLSRRPPGWISELLGARDRTLAGRTAPAHGLTLVEVYYPEVASRGDDPELTLE